MEEFLGREVPMVWSFFVSSLQPPYIYLIMNCIIFSIVASSSLKNRTAQEPTKMQQTTATGWVEAQDDQLGEKGARPSFETIEQGTWYESFDVWAPESEIEGPILLSTNDDGLADFSSKLYCEKPLATARFSHRRSSKSEPEGNLRRVTKLKRQDTLESAWKTIRGECQKQGMRHLGKSETKLTKSHKKVLKSETFRGQQSVKPSPAAGLGNLRREPSMSQDELNRRVEAFIDKFNEEMRLQRQESLNQFHQMINRGAD